MSRGDGRIRGNPANENELQEFLRIAHGFPASVRPTDFTSAATGGANSSKSDVLGGHCGEGKRPSSQRNQLFWRHVQGRIKYLVVISIRPSYAHTVRALRWKLEIMTRRSPERP